MKKGEALRELRTMYHASSLITRVLEERLEQDRETFETATPPDSRVQGRIHMLKELINDLKTKEQNDGI